MKFFREAAKVLLLCVPAVVSHALELTAAAAVETGEATFPVEAVAVV